MTRLHNRLKFYSVCRPAKQNKTAWLLTTEMKHFQVRFYRNYPKFSDRLVLANSADPDQGLHCLLFHLHIFDEIPLGLASVFEF